MSLRATRSPFLETPRWVLISAALAMVTAIVSPAPTAAQYTPPGASRPNGDIPPQTTFEKKIDDAPWNVGGLRLQPWVGIRNAAFVTVDGGEQDLEEDDFTITVGAGLRAYLPVGGKVYWTAHALPEYVWWSENEARRRTNGRYGLGVFGFFNRLRLEASFRLQESQGFFSNEIRRLTTIQEETSRLAAEVDLGSRFLLVGRFVAQDSSNLIGEDLLLSTLDRQEERSLVDLRYRLPQGWTFGIGWDRRSTDFGDTGRPFDNRAEGARLLIAAEGNRVQGTLELSFLTYEAEPGSLFPETDEALGELGIVWNLGRRLDMLNYVRRDLSYALDAGSTYYLGDRIGTRLSYSLRSFRWGLVVETGQDDFRSLVGDSNRQDDVTELGVTIDFTLGRYLTVGFDLFETEYDSNLDLFDRDVTNLGFRVELGRLLEKLSLGSNGGNW